VVRLSVVEVAHFGWAAAGREAAGLVAGGDEFGDPGWWPVGRGGELVGASAGALVFRGSFCGFLGGALSDYEGLVEDPGKLGVANPGLWVSCWRRVRELLGAGDEGDAPDEPCARLAGAVSAAGGCLCCRGCGIGGCG
jgi:hypothetical protein